MLAHRVRAQAARPTRGATAEQRSGNPLWAVPLSSLGATRERPLFTASRRPPAPRVATAVAPPAPLRKPPPAPQSPSLRLVGTVMSPFGSMAVFTDTATNALVRLRAGEGHAGWVLRSVSGREATLRKGGDTAVLALPRRDSPQTASAAAPAETVSPPRIPLPVLRRR